MPGDGECAIRPPSLPLLGRISLDDMALVLVLMFFGIAGAIPGIAPNQASAMTGTPASHLQAVVGIGSQLLVDLFLCSLLVRHGRLLLLHARLLWAPLALGLWALASLCWSIDPMVTGRRALPFLLAAAFGALLALRLPPRRLLLLALTAFALVAAWSALLAVVFPAIGLDASTGHGGDWQGAFTQKNACGRAMVLALAALMAARLDKPQALGSYKAALLALLFGAELILSGSRGAWLIAAILLGMLPALRGMQRLRPRFRAGILWCSGAALVLLSLWAAIHFAEIAPLVGRDATLSGRTQIWQQVWLAIEYRPWLGYGFSAFWQGYSGPSWSIAVALHFVLFHAHNGFLEIWLELGLFGLTIFAATLLRAAVLLWPELRDGRVERAAWPLAILLLTLLYDLDENTLLSFNGLFWVLYTGALVRIEQLAVERRLSSRHRPPPGRFTTAGWLAAPPPAAVAEVVRAAGPTGGSPWI